jgi:hypothetical protein
MQGSIFKIAGQLEHLGCFISHQQQQKDFSLLQDCGRLNPQILISLHLE